MNQAGKYFFFFILSFSSLNIYSQNYSIPEIDSLLSKSERMAATNPDSMLRLAFKAAEMSEVKKSSSYLAKSYFAIGKAYDQTDDLDNEIIYFKKAVETSETTSDSFFTVNSIISLATAFFGKGNYDESYYYFKKAKSLGEAMNNNNLLFEIYSGLGNIFIFDEKKNLDTAVFYYNKANVIAHKEKDRLKMADSYRHLNEVHGAKKEWSEAKEDLEKAIELYTQINNIEGIGRCYKDMGDIYYYAKESSKAIEYYSKAYEIQKNIKNISGISVGACDLAYMYALERKKELLNKFGDEAYSNALKTKSWEIIKYSALWLSRAYEKFGDYEKSYFYSKILVAVNDSITNRSRIEKNQREEVQSRFEEKIKNIKAEEEKQKAISDEKAHNQKIIRNILIAGFIIAIVLLFIAYRSYIEKKRANEIISQQKKEVEEQKIKIEEKNKEITDSINYAKLIQNSILPDPNEIMKVFPQSFGLYKPKSVVSGDFYWFALKNDIAMIAAVDCTGHGVPGALMSMLGVEKLNEAVANNCIHPSEILSHLNKGVKATLRQKDIKSSSKDGMDIALCCFDLKKNILKFSGAQRPLWLIRNNELIEYKSIKVSIGGTTSDEEKFILHEIQLQKEDCIYIFSDGFADQFGGEKGKKIMTKNFKSTLLSIQNIPFLEQEKVLDEKLIEWQGNFEQVDDILVIGIKI